MGGTLTAVPSPLAEIPPLVPGWCDAQSMLEGILQAHISGLWVIARHRRQHPDPILPNCSPHCQATAPVAQSSQYNTPGSGSRDDGVSSTPEEAFLTRKVTLRYNQYTVDRLL